MSAATTEDPSRRAAERRRLFLAFEVPFEQRAEAVRRSERARSALPPARWLRPEAMHVTVLFLGGVEAAGSASLVAALAAAAAAEPRRRLSLRGFGCFPPGRPPRVLWVGVDCAPLADSLYRALALAAAGEGIDVAGEAVYLPHLTLAREYQEPVGPSFDAPEVVLFESRLGRSGARHVPFARLPLAETAC